MVPTTIRREALQVLREELDGALSLGDIKRASSKGSYTFSIIYNWGDQDYDIGKITVTDDGVKHTPQKYIDINIQRIRDGSIIA